MDSEQRLRFVRELAHRSAGRTDFAEFLHFCAVRLRALLRLENCAIFIRGSSSHGGHTSVAAPPSAPPALFARDAVTANILRTGQELCVDDLSAHAEHGTSALRKWHGGALLALPLTIDETPFGVLFLARPIQSQAFGDVDLPVAREIASEVAMAVDGAQRFEEMQRKARQIERSREEIRSYFHQIGAALSTALNLDQLLRLIVNLCIRVTHADGGSVCLIEHGRLRQRVAVGPQAGSATAHVRESLLGWGVRDGVSPTRIERVSLTEGASSTPPPSVRAYLGVPLVMKDEIKGQINIYRHHERDFAPEEMALLATFAGQAALAIENAQMFRFESQRAREATLLYRAARAIAMAADLPEVLRVSVTQMLRVTEADRCMIFLASEDDSATRRGEFRLAHAAGLSPDQTEFFRLMRLRASQLAPSIRDALARGREVTLSGPPPDSPALARLFSLLPANAGLLVPLLAKEQLLGLIFLDDSKMARSYEASQLRLVMTLSLQIATAVQRTRLLAQQGESLEQLQALHEVSTAVTGTLRLPRVLQMVVEKANELLGTHACALLVRMDESGALTLRESRNLPSRLSDEALQNRIATECVKRKRPFTLYLSWPEDRSDARLRNGQADIARALREVTLGGCLAVPLMARRKIVGVLNCFALVGQRFDAASIRLMRSFANQAAAALENARLHEMVEDKLAQLGSLFEVGKAITSTLQLDRVLQTITENVIEVTGADGCAILLLDEPSGLLHMQTSVGLGPQHARRSFSLDSGILGMAARTGKPMMLVDEGVDDAPDGDDIVGPSAFPDAVRRDGMRSILSVPLAVRGKLIGLLNIYERRIHYHAPAEIGVLTTLSSQAAIALENARLYHEKNQVAQLLRSILLPRETFQHPRIEVGHCFLPSQDLAGDYYEMIPLSHDRAAFCIADVSGKGPKAAIYAARAKYIVKSYAQAGQSPREVVTMLNRLICLETEPEMFITLFYGHIDVTRGILEYTSAGHEPPVVWSARRKKTRLLDSSDLVIGVDRESTYVHRRVKLEPGDLVVLYTDGVTEAHGTDPADAFGVPRLQALIRRHAALAPQALADRITASVRTFARRKLHDDFSLMVVRIGHDAREGATRDTQKRTP